MSNAVNSFFALAYGSKEDSRTCGGLAWEG
jgi:hypothetical protein